MLPGRRMAATAMETAMALVLMQTTVAMATSDTAQHDIMKMRDIGVQKPMQDTHSYTVNHPKIAIPSE